MTRNMLETIAKAKRIHLEQYMKVWAAIDDTYTWIHVCLFDEEGVSSSRVTCNEKRFRLSVNAILKREQESPEEYETRNGLAQWITDLA